MNTAQLTGMRMVAEEMTVSKCRTMTAREMALTPHSLSGQGTEFATTADGTVWIWNNHFEYWMVWKKAR